MAQWNGDLVTDDSLELILGTELGDDVGVVGVDVVVGSDTHLQGFAGDADDAFGHIAVTVARMGQGVEVVISRSPATSIDLVFERESDRDGLIVFDGDLMLLDAPLGSAAGIYLPVSRRHGDGSGSGKGADHVGADGEILRLRVAVREQFRCGSIGVAEGESAGNSIPILILDAKGEDPSISFSTHGIDHVLWRYRH